MQYLWTYEQAGTVWVQPKSLLKKNYDELLVFSNFTEDDIVIFDGTPKQRKKLLTTSKAKVWLMGFDRFSKEWRELKEHHPHLNAVVVDEIHSGYGGAKSKRTKEFMLAMKKDFQYFIGMTGTLINGKYSTAFPSIQIIEPRYYMNYDTFLAQHATLDNWGSVVGWRNPNKIARILDKHSVRHTFEECYGNQETVLQHHRVLLTPEQQKYYDECEQEALLELEDEFIAVDTPGVTVIRCRQIMQCPEVLGIKAPVGKDDEIRLILEEHQAAETPVNIFAVFEAEHNRIKQMADQMGMSAAIINGTVSAQKRGEIDKAFQNGEIQVIVASPATASFGFNWGHVDHAVFNSVDYQNGNFIQAYRRNIRGVRKKPLRISVMQYVDNRVESRIFQIVNRKSREMNRVDPSYEILQLGK